MRRSRLRRQSRNRKVSMASSISDGGILRNLMKRKVPAQRPKALGSPRSEVLHHKEGLWSKNYKLSTLIIVEGLSES